MALLWNVPREWAADEPITKEKLNAISDDLNYLFNPSRGLATIRSGSNFVITSTTPVDLEPSVFSLSVELTGSRDVLVQLYGLIQNNTLNTTNRFDVFIDNSTYLSSLTGTPSNTGSWAVNQYVAANSIMVNLRAVLPAGYLSAGVHTFVPRGWTSAGNLTWFEAANFSQFEVGEV